MNKILLQRAIGITAAMILLFAVPLFLGYRAYEDRIPHAKEVILLENLETMRRAIDKFTVDKERSPQSLQQLVESGYLRTIPTDPLTRSADTWITEMEEKPFSPGVPPGIKNVRSGAAGSDFEGKPYRAN